MTARLVHERALTEVIARAEAASTTAEQLDADAVRAAIVAIQRWVGEHPESLIVAHDGVQIPVEAGATVLVRAPDSTGLAAFLAGSGLDTRLRNRANEISAVLEVEYGATRLVLGADLPHLRPGGRAKVETGWELVLERHGHLGRHHGLKIPHHGSTEAQHPGLMTIRDPDVAREWWITPYNRSKLPRLAAGEGLDPLLERQPLICLTALPAALAVQAGAPDSGRVTRAQLVRRLAAQPTGDPFFDDGVEIRPGSGCGPLDGIWCGAFDDTGGLVGRWRGNAALEVLAG